MSKRPTNAAKAKSRQKAAKQVPKMLFSSVAAGGSVLMAAGGGGDDAGPPSWSSVVYTGGKMRPEGFAFPVVAELAGMRLMAGDRPALFAHDQKRPVGHTTKITIGKSLRAEGLLSIDNEDSRLIASSSANGFPWKSSMGVVMEDLRFFDSQETFQANGRTWRGPCYYLAKSQLFEVSFVTVAGDNTSSATIAASFGGHTLEDLSMFEQWLAAKGFDPESLDETQKGVLRAAFDAEQVAATGGAGGTTLVAAGGTVSKPATDVAAELRTLLASGANDYLTEMRTQAAAELQRQASIGTLCASYGNPSILVDASGAPVAEGGREVSLQAHAVAMGWTTDKAELHCLRASRAGGVPAIHTGRNSVVSRDVLECAARLTIGGDNTEARLLKEYGEQTLEASFGLRNIGMRDCARIACEIEGKRIPNFWGDGRETLRAAFTTETLPYVFENVMNKTLLARYERAVSIAKQLCKISRCTDFKQVSRVRFLGSGAWEEVGADGELKHGVVSDSKLTNQAKTYGQFLMLSRQDWMNDDLGALEEISNYMADMGMQVVEDAFFTLLLSNPGSFFHANNANLGAGVAFGSTGLSALKTLFRKQKAGPGTRSANKVPINVEPAILLVPVELEDAADILIGSAELMIEDQKTGSVTTTKTGTKNPHKGKYKILSAPQLSDSAFSGYSATAYYLFAEPGRLPAFDMMFLNGVQTPTIERVDARNDQLGMGFRGYIDFGIKEQEAKGAAKDAGA